MCGALAKLVPHQQNNIAVMNKATVMAQYESVMREVKSHGQAGILEWLRSSLGHGAGFTI